ncbi:MAG: PhnD/SsuA/transferrin family substrate-binding protein [Deltaproteobacteria bacterium]|nr:PhnD/SsuA/transferrin family substrate-binding protein [Deltaproteobacteria bacterium]
MWEVARELADLLHASRFTTIVPFTKYDALQQALLDGTIDAAWGPPLICARVEAAGGTVALRGVRGGQVTYRSALLARGADQFDITTLSAGAFRPRAVWVDSWSMAGYLLPRARLRAAGIDLAAGLLTERTLGSYAACLEAVNAYEADLCASFVGPRTIDQIWGGKAARLKVIALTDEIPNDGIVFSPVLARDRVVELLAQLHGVLASHQAHAVFAQQLHVDGFERPPRDTYAPLLAMI